MTTANRRARATIAFFTPRRLAICIEGKTFIRCDKALPSYLVLIPLIYLRYHFKAGGVVDRVVVGGPAWQELGAQAWAQYSRLADLGTGLVAYPIEGIGSTLLTLAATASHYVETRRAPSATMALYCASALSVAGLLLTTRAAPVMLSLAALQTEDAIRHAFGQFFLWGLYLRGTADVLAFIALISALSSLHRSQGSGTPPKAATHGDT